MTVVAPTPAGGALVTYVTASDVVDAEALRAHAAEALPTYMVPDAFMVLDSIPLTTNGKLDRRALPSPILASTKVFRPPTTPTEGKVAAVLADILSSGPLGLDDNFFHLGGNSLVATTAVARLTEATGVKMPLRALFDHPTVSGIAATIERAAQTPDADGIQVVARPAVLPLAPAQQRLWFLNRVAPESGAYNIPLAVSLRGAVDPDALSAAIVDVVTRHESLRTVFPQIGDNATQKVLGLGEGIAGLESIDVERGSLERVIFEFSSAGFDLVRERPVRYLLITVAAEKEGDDEEAVLVVVLHHMVADGWSLAPLAADLTGAYAARVGGNSPQWAPLPVQYADYTLWHREHLGDASSTDSLAHSQIAFWKQQLAGAPEQLHLPTDRPRALDPTMRGAGVDIRIGASTHQKLVVLAADHDATPFIALHACFALLLARYSGTDDIVIGTPVAGRGDNFLDLLVGMFVNTLALRTVVDRDELFAAHLSQVRAVDVDAFDNADVPFDVVVDALELDRSPAHHPVFQAAITSRIATTHTAELAGVSMMARAVETGLTEFDLERTVTERHEAGAAAGIDATFTYSTDLFDSATVEALARNFVTLVESAVSEPTASVGDLRVLGSRESAATLPRRGVASVGESTLAQILGDTARTYPDAIALEDSERSLSYGELERRSNRIARYLMDLGVGPETPVALAVARSVDSVLAVWSVTKAGGVSSRSIPVIPQIELRTCSRIRVCGSELGPPRLRLVRQPVGTSQSRSTSATRTRLQNVPPTPTLPSTTLTEQRRSLRRRLRTSSTRPARPECRRAPSSLTRVWPIFLANNRIGTGSPPGRELCILRHRASTAQLLRATARRFDRRDDGDRPSRHLRRGGVERVPPKPRGHSCLHHSGCAGDRRSGGRDVTGMRSRRRRRVHAGIGLELGQRAQTAQRIRSDRNHCHGCHQ